MTQQLNPAAAQVEKAAPTAQSPIETIRYWLNAYSDPASGEHFMGHGMMVHLLREYLAMREAQQAAQPVAKCSPTLTECPRCKNDFRQCPMGAQPVAGEPVAQEVPRVWRQALRKLAFMAHTSGGTAGPDSGLMAALNEAAALLSQPYRHTDAPSPVALVPLTLDQISDMEWGAACIGLGWDVRVSAVRAVERAHKIGARDGRL